MADHSEARFERPVASRDPATWQTHPPSTQERCHSAYRPCEVGAMAGEQRYDAPWCVLPNTRLDPQRKDQDSDRKLHQVVESRPGSS
jgi:hypothetical protein